MTEAEFTERVTDMERKLYRVSFSILKNDADCKDAMQEATYRAWNNMPKLRDETRFEAWLTSILINECKDIKRRAARHTECELPEQIPAPEVDHSVSEAIFSLNGKQRDSMALHYIEGYNVGEIAEMLDARPGTVKSWLHHGRRKLKTILIAVIITLLLIGAAIGISLNSTLLSWLFEGATPPEALQTSVSHNASYIEKDGVSINIDECLFEANTLSYLWTVTSQAPEMVIYEIDFDTISLEAIQISGFNSGHDIGAGSMVVLNADCGDIQTEASHQGYFLMNFDGWTPKEPLSTTITIHAYTTDLTPTLMKDDYIDVSILSDDPLATELSLNKQLPVSKYGLTNLTQDPLYIKALSALTKTIETPAADASQAAWDDYDGALKRARVKAYEDSGLLKPLTTLTATVTIDPAQAPARSVVMIGERNIFEFSDYTLEIRKMSFFATSTEVELFIRPKENARPDAVFLFANENYDLNLFDITGGASGSGIQKNGVNVGYGWTGGPAQRVPRHLNILLTDKETLGLSDTPSQGHAEVLLFPLFAKPVDKDIKSLFDSAPKEDVATAYFVKHEQ